MILQDAIEADYPEIIDLANVAYRKTGPGSSWNSEEGLIAGQRLNDSLLRDEFARKPDAHLLVYRGTVGGPLLGTVWLEPKNLAPKDSETWYLGLLTVRPDMQARGLGKTILAAAEDFVRSDGGKRIRMTVLHVRTTLIAWYERRGYTLTGETEPWHYDDDRFGTALRDDLYFVVMEKSL
jgi:ribosomal protein S18 acetylase RimI-like enzyme